MSPPAPVDVDLKGDSSVASPLTVDGVAAWRAKQPKMSLAVSARSDCSMFKSPVSTLDWSSENIELIAHPKAKRWDRMRI